MVSGCGGLLHIDQITLGLRCGVESRTSRWILRECGRRAVRI